MDRYSVDIDLKKTVDENSLAEDARVNTRKAVKRIFEEKYRNQTAKNDKKSAGVQYFFNKLRF
jgi:large subunit ribosomal protein L27e